MERAHGTRRVWLPAAFFGAFALALLARLVYIQVLQHDYYAERAHSELLDSSTVAAPRGAILDRNGAVLAASVDTFDLYISRRAWRDEAVARSASETMARVLRADAAAIRRQVLDSDAVDVLIRRDVPWDAGQELQRQGVAGLVARPNTVRINPEGDLAASVLGFIGLDNTGLAGIEAAYDDILRGKSGRAIYERDTAGRPIPFGRYLAEQPEPGQDVVLTLDRHLQRMAEGYLAAAINHHRAKGGALIIMDPDTGEVLALAVSPGMKYSTLDLSDQRTLALLKNRAVTDLYEPGSVMKVITAAAAIDAGVVTPNTTYVDTGVASVNGVRIKNWDDSVYGEQTMTQVLQHSINTGAIFMAQALGVARFHAYLDAFGFGRATQVGLDPDGEAAGIMRRPRDSGWSPVDLATQAFGQSISVTPIQMITAVAAAINGGRLLRPHIVKATVTSGGLRQQTRPEVLGQPISAATSATMREMLREVVDPAEATHPGQPKNYLAGGKSGTANVPIVNGYDERHIASFIGFAPVEAPRILILVKLDENADGLTGTQAAAPVFAALTDEALRYLNVRPDRGARVSVR